MKARYQYRIYPTDQQKQSLAQLFGCVRVVWNDALALCKQSEKKPKSSELQKTVITQAKLTLERTWLSEVSNIPLQQSVADLDVAFKNFFDSCKGKRTRNIAQVGIGNYQDSKWALRDCQTISVAEPDEGSRMTVAVIPGEYFK